MFFVGVGRNENLECHPTVVTFSCVGICISETQNVSLKIRSYFASKSVVKGNIIHLHMRTKRPELCTKIVIVLEDLASPMPSILFTSCKIENITPCQICFGNITTTYFIPAWWKISQNMFKIKEPQKELVYKFFQ